MVFLIDNSCETWAIISPKKLLMGNVNKMIVYFVNTWIHRSKLVRTNGNLLVYQVKI